MFSWGAGPASNTDVMLRKLFTAGVDVFRLNFSHGTHEDHKKTYDRLRAVEAEMGRPICVLADLQGPKLRVGKFKDGKVELKEGQLWRLDLDPTPGDDKRGMLFFFLYISQSFWPIDSLTQPHLMHSATPSSGDSGCSET